MMTIKATSFFLIILQTAINSTKLKFMSSTFVDMNILLIFVATIASSSVTAEANVENRKNIESVTGRLRNIPLTPKKDPWLLPSEGVLVAGHTPVYNAFRKADGRIEFREIPGAMEQIATDVLTNEKYRKANVENIVKQNNYPVEHNSVPSSTNEGQSKVLYPRIMVVVSHELYEKFGHNINEVVPYLLAFWNGVDMLYRSFENPKIRLNIAGIILETEAGLLPYLFSDRRNEDHVSAMAFFKSKIFWANYKNEISPENYDAIVTMITRYMCHDIFTRTCKDLAAGFSNKGTICLSDDNPVIIEKSVIFQDDGKFDGISTAAHELGHTFGMDHDQQMLMTRDLDDFPSCRNVGSGYLMHDTAYGLATTTYYKQRWSSCSLEQLEKFVHDKNLTCYNPPTVGGTHIPRLLPGKLRGLDDYCGSPLRPCTGNCTIDPCENITCDSGHYNFQIDNVGPEGIPCDADDPNKFCMFGRCISAAEFT